MSVSAQSYVLLPGDTVAMTGALEDLETLSIQQLNPGTDSLYLAWRKVEESVPQGWDAYVCDNVTCYTTLLDSGSMAPVAPGDYGFLLLHITPHMEGGAAVVRYAVWDIDAPGLVDTLTFMLTVQATGIGEATGGEAFTVSPDPAQDAFLINVLKPGIHPYRIMDRSGRIMAAGTLNGGQLRIPTAGWSNGVYFMSLTDGTTITTQPMIPCK
ncbi:MAG: T9SS type A sorting domain-containing protein [Flavobacteriales bacterium]|nr:T9SS type A sorting domain-containing protein [Flavobacteriales bacterium]